MLLIFSRQDVSAQEAKVVRLLEWGADPNVVYGPTQMTPLHMAASWHRTGLVTKLLAHGADAGKPDVNGLTPLHCAVVYAPRSRRRRAGLLTIRRRVGTGILIQFEQSYKQATVICREPCQLCAETLIFSTVPLRVKLRTRL